MAWDWYLVGEIALGVGMGVGGGALVAVSALRTLAYEVLSHPAVRKLAGAAEKLTGKSGGIIEQIVGGLFGGKKE